jgi:hypothetical protein
MTYNSYVTTHERRHQRWESSVAQALFDHSPIINASRRIFRAGRTCTPADMTPPRQRLPALHLVSNAHRRPLWHFAQWPFVVPPCVTPAHPQRQGGPSVHPVLPIRRRLVTHSTMIATRVKTAVAVMQRTTRTSRFRNTTTARIIRMETQRTTTSLHLLTANRTAGAGVVRTGGVKATIHPKKPPVELPLRRQRSRRVPMTWTTTRRKPLVRNQVTPQRRLSPRPHIAAASRAATRAA